LLKVNYPLLVVKEIDDDPPLPSPPPVAVLTNVALRGMPPVLRSSGLAEIVVVSSSHGYIYEGPIILAIRDANGSILTTSVPPSSKGVDILMVVLNRDEASTPEKVFTVYASNGLSSLNKSISVVLAGKLWT
jgi:hypothetical protein